MNGILFKEELFNMVVAGLKTETRREGSLKEINSTGSDRWGNPSLTAAGFQLLQVNGPGVFFPRPRYKANDYVFLKEPMVFGDGQIHYQYGNRNEGVRSRKWTNKMFMKLEFARFFLKVEKVSLVRLLDTDLPTMRREGFLDDDLDRLDENILRQRWVNWFAEKSDYESHLAFKNNPWLWAYQFSLVQDFDAMTRNLPGRIVCRLDKKLFNIGLEAFLSRYEPPAAMMCGDSPCDVHHPAITKEMIVNAAVTCCEDLPNMQQVSCQPMNAPRVESIRITKDESGNVWIEGEEYDAHFEKGQFRLTKIINQKAGWFMDSKSATQRQQVKYFHQLKSKPHESK